MIHKLELQKFKKVENAELNLEKVNVIVGGNNSGKSSILQGIHFSITTSAIARQQRLTTFSSDLLLYNPTPDFCTLRNGNPYRNYGGDDSSKLKLTSTITNGDNMDEISYSIRIYKGRNHGNIGCERSGNMQLGQDITDPNQLFTIYVPGLAGIPQKEELRSKAIIRRGVASGDSNIYLRNVIYYIDEEGKLDALNRRLQYAFPGYEIKKSFDPINDTYIKVFVVSDGREMPLELAGTGVLQVVQILSYITYFRPNLLLLDEPDSHLHPDNQVVLSDMLSHITEETDMQVMLCTHSKHLVESLYGQANFIWMKEGLVFDQGNDIDKLPILVDIGALDDFGKLNNGDIKALFLTEDRNTRYLQKLLAANGFDLSEILIYSYKTSSNIESAELFVDFIHNVAHECKVVIHRDRDFMTSEEVARIESKIRDVNAIPFITTGSDIESYFIDEDHLAEILGTEVDEVNIWIHEIATNYHTRIQHEFTRKRDEVKRKLYRFNPDECPDTIRLIGNDVPLARNKRKGKFMIRKIRGNMQSKFGRQVDIATASEYLNCPVLQEIKVELSN